MGGASRRVPGHARVRIVAVEVRGYKFREWGYLVTCSCGEWGASTDVEAAQAWHRDHKDAVLTEKEAGNAVA